MSTFLCRYWIAWFRSVTVLCRNRYFVLVPVPLKDRKKRCNTISCLFLYKILFRIKSRFNKYMSLKSKFSCLYCAKIFKDPVILPCNRNICEHYLKDAKVVKENKIVCPKCNKSFEVKILSLK